MALRNNSYLLSKNGIFQQNNEDIIEILNKLDWLKSNGTSFISLYIPGKTNPVDIRNFIRNEIDESNNIKSKQTRNNVQDSLKSILRCLKNINKFPEKGIVIFSGTILEIIESPIIIKKKIYICGKKFETDLLRSELKSKNNIGYIVIDGNMCDVFIVNGQNETRVFHKEVNLDGDTSRGGQSQNRHMRNRDIQKNNYLTICAEGVRKSLENKELRAVFLGGNGDFKKKFTKFDIGNVKIDNVITIQKNGLLGLRECINLSYEYLDKSDMKNEKEVMKRFITILENSPNRIRFGKKDVEDMINSGMVEELLTCDSEYQCDGVEKIHYISGRTSESQILVDTGIACILFYPIDFDE